MMEKTFVVGHLNPDTDTIVGAMALAAFLNARESTNHYQAIMTGEPNSETRYVFDRFGLKFPEIVKDAKGKLLYLVDHNEAGQILAGHETENIIGFVDHHKVNFTCSKPIEIICKPWGSSNSIIYDLFKKETLEIPAMLRPAMLAAILSDTVILKSPTTTPVDMMVVEELSEELGIDPHELGMEMFKAKAKVAEKTAEQIIKNDFKDFDFKGKKVGIGQIETPDITEVEPKFPEILAKMSELKAQGYHSVILIVTDIIQEGSRLLIVSDELEKVVSIFQTRHKKGVSDFLSGVMSRKKQVAPPLSEKL